MKQIELLWLRFWKWHLLPAGASPSPSWLLDVFRVVDGGAGEPLWQRHVAVMVDLSAPAQRSIACASEGLSSVAGSWLEPTYRRWSSVVARFTKLNRWPVLWLWPEVLVPATQPSRWPYGSVGWSLLPLVPSSLPVTWFARGLTLPWSLTSDDCVPSVCLCETWVTLHRQVSVQNTPIQQWFPFSSGLETCENILFAYQQQYPLVYTLLWCISAITAVDWSYPSIQSSIKLDKIDFL